MAGRSFGEFVRDKRIEQRLTLREFCRKNGFDPGNVSKIERGLMPPPQDRHLAENYAKALNLKKRTKDWVTFHDLAAVSAGRVPADLLNDEKIVRKLPLLFRTIRGTKLECTAPPKSAQV